MLTFLKVKGFAIIDELQIEFGEGLNVITGETGAGKSIIINALSTLMRTKVSPDIVRTNAEYAEILGHFFYKDNEYVLKRIVNANGRSRSFLNDDPITTAKLAELGDALINIYGQNEFQYLLDKENYIGILDRLLSLDSERLTLGEKVQALRKCESELSAKKREAEGREKEIALLDFQIDEIERTALQEGEEERVKERLKILRDAEKITASLNAISEGLYEGEESVHNAIKRFASLLRPFHSIDTMQKLMERIETVSYDIEDIFLQIRDLEKGLLYDPDEQQKLDNRLQSIYELKNKYGKSFDEIKKFATSAQERLTYLKTLTTDIGDLEKQKASLEAEVKNLAHQLSEKRKKGTKPVGSAIVGELEFLSMKGMLFNIAIADRGTIDENGKDDIDFLISTNPGEPLKPLRKIASGGELSRIMLAIKRVIGGDEEKTLIFDEVDAGIGGRVADLVGRRLQDLAGKHQVICITHLPQIATYADRHFLVEKIVRKGSARTDIKHIDDSERVQELARMLGGATITEKTIQRAEEMIHHATKGIH
jgi:DNA repair protein RecN (Recombination protein N)